MAKKPEWWDYSVPPIYPQTYLRVAGERGADPALLLERAGLSTDFMQHPTDIPVLQMQSLIEAVCSEVGDNGLGIDIGWNLPPTAFGSFGYALLSSETMGDVLELTQRFWHLVGRGTNLSLREQNDLFVTELTLAGPFPEMHQRLICETTFTSLYRGIQLLAGPQAEDMEIWFDFSEPEHGDKARRILGNVRYGMPANQFHFPQRLAETRLGMHNPTALKFAIEQCEREEALLGSESDKVVSRVRERMVFDMDGYPSLVDISKQLNMTARTLRRRLDQEGTSFKKLTEEAKRRDALRLLDDYSLDIQKVAVLLGYQDPANFTRAFRQWTGQTPSQYRKTRRSG